MLIKKRKLISIKGGREASRILSSEHIEVNKSLQLEIQKVKEEARQIKNEAKMVLAESEQQLKQAEAKVKEIISNANLEAKTIKEKIFNETLQAANEEAEQMKNQARILLKELFEVKKEALTQANKEIIKVALDLAEKIIRYKVSVDPDVLQTQVVEAIKKATSEADRVQVFVNPNDLKALEEKIPQMERLFPSGVDIISLASDSVDPGSCIIETKSGQLDARFSTQLQALTDLISHIEVIEPNIEINEQIQTVKSKEISFAEIEEETATLIVKEDEKLTEIEMEVLEKELLGENQFPFISNEQIPSYSEPLQLEEESLLQENKIVSIPEEIIQNTNEQEIIEVENEEVAIEPAISAQQVQQKKRLNIDSLSERTKKEAEELDENLVFEYEEESEEKKEEEIKPINILKPKKSVSSEVSNIASELEENPEWKGVVEEEE